jgi:hypothetical protein
MTKSGIIKPQRTSTLPAVIGAAQSLKKYSPDVLKV